MKKKEFFEILEKTSLKENEISEKLNNFEKLSEK
ncbi:MAG: hypothetical protein ACI86H_002120 [bacterium]|jgi:hypothetical protein